MKKVCSTCKHYLRLDSRHCSCEYPCFDHVHWEPNEMLAAFKRAYTDGTEYIKHRSGQLLIPKIKDVIFNDPATIVFWSDGTKTVVKCQKGDDFDPEKGLAMAISKKALGNKSNFNNEINKWTEPYYEELWVNYLDTDTAIYRALSKMTDAIRSSIFTHTKFDEVIKENKKHEKD